jgi:hypothetical protein
VSEERDVSEQRRHSAGAFDVRNVIAGLIGFYGVVLVVMGLVANSEAEKAKTGDVNANLWAGIAMVVFALAFALWTRLRPVVVEQPRSEDGDRDAPPQG